MWRFDRHLTGRELLMEADDELPPGGSRASAHLATCALCRFRVQKLRGDVAEIFRAREAWLAPQLPPAIPSASSFRARLASEAARPLAHLSRPGTAGQFVASKKLVRFLLPAVAGVFAVAAVLVVFGVAVRAEGPRPISRFTPGEIRQVSLTEVCRDGGASSFVRDIPEATRKRVFSLYGINPAQPGQFEVDYLITPELGGADSIRNLWPQPYSARWNAHVKDRLEQKLHDLVCEGRLDLATAQHDIAVDWIGAYKRYVDPVPPNAAR